MTFRPSPAAPILAVLAIALVMLGAYVGGYFWLGKRFDLHYVTHAAGPPDEIMRRYNNKQVVWLFKPAATVEAWLVGVPVSTDHWE